MSPSSTWSKTFVEWIDGKTAYLSVVFTWDLPKAYQRAVWRREEGYHVVAGGPAVKLMPDHLEEVAEIGSDMPGVLDRHNLEATFTSRGCIRKCAFCAVPKIEGGLIELEEWEPRRVVCDNNLTACSWPHFCRVIDTLGQIRGIDFQGIDARLITPSHAYLLSRLDLRVLRVAWDHIDMDPWEGVGYLLREGIPKRAIHIYVLIGFNDSPEDAEYRLRTIRNRGFLPCPQRYNPLDALVRDAYVDSAWTDAELRRFMRYWYTPQVWAVPFEEFDG